MYLFCFLGKSPFSLAVSGILEKKKGDAIRVSLQSVEKVRLELGFF